MSHYSRQRKEQNTHLMWGMVIVWGWDSGYVCVCGEEEGGGEPRNTEHDQMVKGLECPTKDSTLTLEPW